MLTSLTIDKDTGGFVMVAGSPTFIQGKDAKAQQVRIRLQTFQGEYFLDPNLGVPYFTDILLKNPNIQYVEFVFAETLRELSLIDIEIHGQYDKSLRTFTVAWQGVDPDSQDQISGTLG